MRDGVLKNQRAFTLIETLVAVAIFAILATSAWVGLANIFRANQDLRAKTTAVNLATEQIEVIRNLPYGDVGVENSIPDGVIPRTQILIRDGREFEVVTTIRNIDQEYDGTIGGTPNDLSPADNKLATVEVTCVTCSENVGTIVHNTWVAPLALESTGNNGALFINVFDANGQPLQGVNVHIENNATTTPIIIDDVTNNDGVLQIVDAYPGTNAYEITVSKEGYSTERTYALGDLDNPVPDKPHANVVAGDITEISFSIDETATLEINTNDIACAPESNISFNLRGDKTIGYETYKHDVDYDSGAFADVTIDDLEWDTYSLSLLESGYDLIGVNPSTPFTVNPGSSQRVDVAVANSDPNAVLVTVFDGSNEQLLSEALVTFDAGADVRTASTGSGYLEQIDWSGGSGQEDFANETKYFNDDADVDVTTTAGEITLASLSGTYETAGWLESSTFDVGTTTNFLAIHWQPVDQPLQTGAESVKFQIATNETLEDPLIWNYRGPDGTGATYYTTPGDALNNLHDDDRYLRYKVFLETSDTNYTPNVSRVWFTFSNGCTPVGQAYLGGLSGSASYDVTIEKTGYISVTLENQAFTDAWQTLDVTLDLE